MVLFHALWKLENILWIQNLNIYRGILIRSSSPGGPSHPPRWGTLIFMGNLNRAFKKPHGVAERSQWVALKCLHYWQPRKYFRKLLRNTEKFAFRCIDFEVIHQELAKMPLLSAFVFWRWWGCQSSYLSQMSQIIFVEKNCHEEKFWEFLEEFWGILRNFGKFWEILPQFTGFHVEKNWAQKVHLWRKNDKYEVGVNYLEKGGIWKYLPWGPRDLPRRGLLTPRPKRVPDDRAGEQFWGQRAEELVQCPCHGKSWGPWSANFPTNCNSTFFPRINEAKFWLTCDMT